MLKPLSLLVFLTGVFVSSPLSAEIIKKPVRYHHGKVEVEGFLAYDDAKTANGKLPGVMVFQEWWGVNGFVKDRTVEIARLGYVAFAAGIYANGETTEEPKRAQELVNEFYGKPLMAERAKAGMDQLVSTGLVDPSKIAAIGFCFGGAVAQTLAYSGAPLLGIVSFHGSPVQPPEDAAQKVKARFLILNGAADPLVPTEAKHNLEKSLRAAGIPFETVDYPGALHAFTNPDADTIAKQKGLEGKIAYNADAAQQSWEKMRTFLSSIF